MRSLEGQLRPALQVLWCCQLRYNLQCFHGVFGSPPVLAHPRFCCCCGCAQRFDTHRHEARPARHVCGMRRLTTGARMIATTNTIGKLCTPIRSSTNPLTLASLTRPLPINARAICHSYSIAITRPSHRSSVVGHTGATISAPRSFILLNGLRRSSQDHSILRPRLDRSC